MSAPKGRSPRGKGRDKKGGRPAKTSLETLRIKSLASGGAGVARRASGEVVFVQNVAAGELVEVDVEVGKSPARGALRRVVEVSPERVSPPCPFVATCGGCDWMHLSASAQQAAHAAIVASAIAHALGASESSLPALRIHPAAASLGFRTRARLLVRGARDGVHVGYRAAGSHEVAVVDRCAVLHPSLEALFAPIAWCLEGARGDGEARITLGQGGLPVVDLTFRGETDPITFQRLDAKVSSGEWAGAQLLFEGAAAPATFGDPRGVMLGADGETLHFAEGGFAQPSPEGSAALAKRVAELARLDGEAPRHIVELFAGSGTLSILLAPGAASFTAVESDPDAVAYARENLTARGLAAKILAADADTFAIPKRTDVVVLDPPRTGAKGAARAIAESRARAVVYVACDPQTLARDLAVLTSRGLAITDIETFELFPQTSHVETVVRLARDQGGEPRPAALG